MYPDLDNKDIYMFYLFDSKLKYSFETEDSMYNDNALEYLTGEFIDDHTFQGVVKVDLYSVLNYYSKDTLESSDYYVDLDTPRSHYELPDTFTVDFELNSIRTDVYNPEIEKLSNQERFNLPAKNEYENWWIDGPWNFTFEVEVDRENSVTKSIDVEGLPDISKITITKTPFELEEEDDDKYINYVVVVVDKNGKHIKGEYSLQTLPIDGFDVSEITVYVCDYYEYMDDIKGVMLDTTDARTILDEKALWSGKLEF